jgi:AraC-like DNA-binding protein
MLHIDCHILPHLTLMGRFRQHRGWDHNGRTLGEHLLMVMWQGDCTLSVEENTYQLGSGDAMIIPAGQYYRPRTEEGCEYYYFHFSDAPSLPDALPHRMIALPYCISVSKEHQQEILLLAQRVYDTHPDAPGPMPSLSADLNLTQLLLRLANLASEAAAHDTLPPALLGKVVLYIRQHVAEQITLTELSSRFSVSKQYIMRLFRHHLNTTPTTYIHRAKLETARWLLTHSSMNVTEISDYLGFSGCYYFSRLFKKYYNLTPLQYTRETLGRG